MTAAKVQSIAQGAGLVVLLLALVACAAQQVLEVLAVERHRRERSSRPQLVVPGCEVGRDGQSFDGAASVAPSPAPVPAVDDRPVGYVDDEIARTVRRVHLDGSL